MAEFFDKVKLLLSRPSELFEAVKGKKEGMLQALTFYAVISVVAAVLSAVSMAFSFSTVLGISGGGSQYAGELISAFGTFLIVDAVVLLAASLLTIVISKLLQAKNGWKETAKVVIYSLSPAVFAAAIPLPFAPLVVAIYSVVLMAKGLMRLNGMSLGKAIATIVVMVLLIVGLLAIVIVALLSSLSGMSL